MLVINGRFLTLPGGGVRRFALELCYALCTAYQDVIIATPPGTPVALGLPIRHTGILRGHSWEQAALPRFLKKQGLPVLVNPANTGPLLYPKSIVILHDMAWFYKEQSFSPLLYRGYRYLIPALLKRAMAVGSVSDFSRGEIEKIFPFLQGRVFVVSPSLEYLAAWKAKQPREWDGNEPLDFCLAVGLTTDRKEAHTLFKAFTARPELKLIVAGYSVRIVEKVKSIPSNVQLIPKISDAELAWLYPRCRALISTSRYEGFDLPPLEAAWFGRPVILSDIPVHREIWGDKALYFRVGDADDLAEKLSLFLSISEKTDPTFARSFNRNRMLQMFQEAIVKAGISF